MRLPQLRLVDAYKAQTGRCNVHPAHMELVRVGQREKEHAFAYV
jgi:hypothetical protein